MKDNKISIIIPVYNCEKYFVETLNSIVEQTYTNIEVLLIDDGSTDSSGKICDMFAKKDSRIKVYHKKNGGVSSARNFGIEKSTGDWISFVDSDDIIDKNYCYSLISVTDLDVDLVIGRTISFSKNNIKLMNDDGYSGGTVDILKDNFDKQELYSSILCDNSNIIKYPHISTCSAKLIRKSLINSNNIQYDTNIFLYEDAFFNMQVIKNANTIKMIDKKIYFYRLNDESSSNKFNEKMIDQYDYIYDVFTNYSNDNNLNFDEYFDYFKVKNLNIILTNYFKCNKYNKNFINKIILKYNSSIKKVKISILPKRRKLLKVIISLKLYRLLSILYK